MRTLAGKVLATIAAASATLVVGLPSVSAQHADGHHGHTMGGGGGDQDMHRSMAPGMNNMMSMQSTGDIDRDFAKAAANRFHLSPRLERAMRSGDHAGAVRSLRRSLMMETSAAALILALVASLGILSPVGA
ncbi:hypothetical protein [Cupriavidus gilardii]|uniref:hypothetical protein n=1 Tax=Cupriavidus gilardii TaxID=82541 RepID=UPI003B28BEDC